MKMMKSLSALTLLLSILLCQFQVFSQDNEVVIRTVDSESNSRSLSFGLFGAVNVGWIRSDTKGYQSDGVQPGLSYGLITDFSLEKNDNYFFSTGVIINNIGGVMNNPSVVSLTDSVGTIVLEPARRQVEYSIRQIEVPISLKMKTNEIGYIKYFGQFGISPAFNIRTTQKGEDFYDSGSQQLDENADLDVRVFRVGVLAAAGIEYNLTGHTNLVLSLSYNGAFTNALKGQVTAGSDERRAFEVDENGITDVTKVTSKGEPYIISSGPELLTRADFASFNVAIFF